MAPKKSGAPGDGSRPHVIVVGNEKGGTGKSTTAVHLAIALMARGASVATLDLDARQASLTRYLENRAAYAARQAIDLPSPAHVRMTDQPDDFDAAVALVEQQLRGFAGCNFVVVDTPGSASLLSRAGHEAADTLITPVNDSFVDIDVLARIDRDRRQILSPSVYSQMVWEAHNRRIVEGRPPIDWIVMRNRLSHIDARNKRDLTRLLEALGNRIGFRTAPGFGERVVFRELFLSGRTVLDLAADSMTPSQRSACQELDALLEAIGLVPQDEAALQTAG